MERLETIKQNNKVLEQLGLGPGSSLLTCINETKHPHDHEPDVSHLPKRGTRQNPITMVPPLIDHRDKRPRRTFPPSSSNYCENLRKERQKQESKQENKLEKQKETESVNFGNDFTMQRFHRAPMPNPSLHNTETERVYFVAKSELQARCDYCKRVYVLTIENRTFRDHGPKENRCPGSGTPGIPLHLIHNQQNKLKLRLTRWRLLTKFIGRIMRWYRRIQGIRPGGSQVTAAQESFELTGRMCE